MTFTLAICCYNFERFIEEAIDGAFAQTYRPLEIVISDDHSPDRTWEKILAKVASYGYQVPSPDAVGSYRLSLNAQPSTLNSQLSTSTLKPQTSLSLILNRNPTNLGLALHENKLFELSSGDYIAFQAGDDVSAPERVEKIAAAVEANPKIRCLHCHPLVVDEGGQPMPIPAEFLAEQNFFSNQDDTLPYVLGAGAVYHKDVYRVFGPLGLNVGNEDHVLPLRAKLIGDVHYIEDRLVHYRKHNDNASGSYSHDPDKVARYRLRMMYMYYQELTDLHYAEVNGLVGFKKARHYRSLVEDQLYIMDFLGNWRLHPEMRRMLFFVLITSPRALFLFARKILDRGRRIFISRLFSGRVSEK